MEEKQQNDLLIKVDTTQTLMLEKLRLIESKIDVLPIYEEKIKILEKITWFAIILVLSSLLKNFYDFVKT